MTKLYFSLMLMLFLSAGVAAQERQLGKSQDQIEGLSFYPNPVSNGKIYITSKSSGAKEVTIFDVLGKKVLQKIVESKELNVSELSPGVYIIKIREDEATATRKLIIK
ncbi:MAG TPA: T9SS type A sorting domain-containing protein [Flavobacterium sp.]|nr:T9SS type A sorting domain-containing protein [Flavobacterium sp.]